ncbi:MAG: ABC transporter permease [Chloroflexi bacterium]|nr:MAG: ABC transporter permease [Chloroflexota bacterium]
MILKYVLKNFTRRKVRTILMILSLMVSTGLIVAMSATVETIRRSNVDLIATAVGRYDLAISKRDTSPFLFMPIDETISAIVNADEQITAVFPRFHIPIEMNSNGRLTTGTLIALDNTTDDIGFIDVVEGEYTIGNGTAVLLESTALDYGLHVGDVIDVAYDFPFPRETGKPATTGTSLRRTTHRFTISGIVRQDGVAGADVRTGLIAHINDVQAWLDLSGQAQLLVVAVNQSLYETSNAEIAALRVREVAKHVQDQLGDEFSVEIGKAAILDEAAQGFLALQALINTYGLIALGVVGLLVHTLVMTNVQEQRRDMAVLRILGAQRRFLFSLVIVEVLVIGVIGVTLGVGLGQLITAYIVVPLIELQMAQQGITAPLTPQVTITAVLPPTISAFVVLIISSLKPAQDAARTKVMHAINPGVADNLQIEDLAHLRERGPNRRLFLSGLGLMSIFALIGSFQAVDAFGGPALEVAFFLLALGLMVLGLGLMFFITTVPFERLVLLVMSGFVPRLTYFARRNVGRGSLRNTLISLLVLFSGVLPSFLATQLALENANFETTTQLDMGAPIAVQIFARWNAVDDLNMGRLRPDEFAELTAVPGIDQAVGLSADFATRISDQVGMRSAAVDVVGVNGRLNSVLFTDMMEFVGGSPDALDRILSEPNTIIISEGLAEHLAVSLNDTVKLTGQGPDNIINARVIGIARRIPGFENIMRSRVRAQSNSQVLVSLDTYNRLITPLNEPLPDQTEPVYQKVLATLTPDSDAELVAREISERFSQEFALWPRVYPVVLEQNERAQASLRVFLLVLTVISFTTAVFGVFAVIYVTIYARRLEIGMMKAMGMLRRELTGMLVVEAITMTLGAALAGIAAGATMGYVSFYMDRVLQERPIIPAVDFTVAPFIVIMVVLASILGAIFSARRIVKKRAVEILRMQ